MKTEFIFTHFSNLLDTFEKNPSTFDSVVSQYLKKNHAIGSKDRKFLQEIIFTYIRHKTLIDAFLNSLQLDSSRQAQILSLIFLHNSYFNIEISTLLHKFDIHLILEKEICEKIYTDFSLFVHNLQNSVDFNSQSLLYSLPVDFAKLIPDNVDYIELAKSLLVPASVNLRIINPTKNKSKVEEFLNKNNIAFEYCSLAPNAIKLKSRFNIKDSEIYRNAMIEIQDEGSQIISFVLGNLSNKSILDACAGAGGKTLHLADLADKSTKIVASDQNQARMKSLAERNERQKFKNISLSNEISLFTSIDKFDVILIDAPCSGSGTIRRSPWIKESLNEEKVSEYAKLQLNILTTYKSLLKKGGRIVYSTCSLFELENQSVINTFLQNNPNFRLASIKDSFELYNINIELTNQSMLNLYPHVHSTDGFFIACLESIK